MTPHDPPPTDCTPGSGPVVAKDEAVSDRPRYQVVDEIGRGGMGAILQVEDIDLCRDVAMKVMLDASCEEHRSRFFLEARVTGLLEHPNVVPVHQLGQDEDGRPFFTMKLVRGRSLFHILGDLRKQAPRPWERRELYELLQVFLGACNGIAFAHSKRILHRDLKPDNIMVGDFGEVLVLDWGIAKLLDEPQEEERRSTKQILGATGVGGGAIARESGTFSPTTHPSSRGETSVSRLRERTEANLTSADVVLGTPYYLPPEHALGRHDEVDERADVYALGAILYEILTLERPVEGGNMAAVLKNVVIGTVIPPVERTPQRRIPSELSAVAMKALSKEPRDRYGSVGALIRDVELFLQGRAVSAKEDSPIEALVKLLRRNRGAAIASAIAASLLLVLGALGWRAQRAEQERTAEALRAMRTAQLHSAPELARVAERALAAGEEEAALSAADTALSYDPLLTRARLTRGLLQVAEGRVEEADVDLSLHLAMHPEDKAATELLRVCRRARSEPLSGLKPELAEALRAMGHERLARRISPATGPSGGRGGGEAPGGAPGP